MSNIIPRSSGTNLKTVNDSSVSDSTTYSSEKTEFLLSRKADKVWAWQPWRIIITDSDWNLDVSDRNLWGFSPSTHGHPATMISVDNLNFWWTLDQTITNMQELLDYIDNNFAFWNTIYTDDTEPSGGRNWDIWIDTTDYDLYQYNDAWVLVGSLKWVKWDKWEKWDAWADGADGADGIDWTWSIESVVGWTGMHIDIADPDNPIINFNWTLTANNYDDTDKAKLNWIEAQSTNSPRVYVRFIDRPATPRDWDIWIDALWLEKLGNTYVYESNDWQLLGNLNFHTASNVPYSPLNWAPASTIQDAIDITYNTSIRYAWESDTMPSASSKANNLFFDTSNSTLYYSDGSTWIALNS